MVETRRAFVCGHPIAHSRSPKIHSYWLRQLGIDGSYTAIDVPPEDFPKFAGSLRENGLVGGNVTIPHKQAAFEACEWHDEAAQAIGAVNTLWLEGEKLCGANTDAYGFLANLDDAAPGWRGGRRTAVVLGAGGAARAILHALKTSGFVDIRVVNRTFSRAMELAEHFGPAVSAHSPEVLPGLLGDASLLVNTTSLGMSGKEDLQLDLSRLPSDALVTDLVYIPLETPLLREARQRGLETVDGLGMLLHQAVPGFGRWFGVRPAVTAELRSLIVADMAAR